MAMNPGEEGTPDRPICVLGEAPSHVEMRLGRPLVGPSGEVFNDCLRASGIARGECYILNIWPFQVTKDKRTDDIYRSNTLLWHHSRGFTDDGLALAGPTIDKINKCTANIILTMGTQAFHLVEGAARPIMKWRGSPLWSSGFNKKFIPTIHPASTLHGTYIWRYLIQSDMAKVRLESLTPKLELPKRSFIISPSLTEVLLYIGACHRAKLVATDLEVINHQISCFSLSFDPKEAMTVPMVGPDGGHYWTEEEEIKIWQAYGALMADASTAKVNHNLVGFDAPFLWTRNRIRTRGPLYDTMIAHSIMYPQLDKGLDLLASFHTREPYWKDDGKIWKQIDPDWGKFQRYCGRDAAVALELWNVLSMEMSDGDYWPTYNMTVSMAEPLTYMTAEGLAVDKSGLSVTHGLLEKEIEEKQAALNALVGFDLNVNSAKQCKEYFYEKLGNAPYLNGAGGVTTNDKAMARLSRKGIKAASLVQEIRALKKLKGTYIEVEIDNDNRLRCSWNPRGTWAGRLSSSKTIIGTGMNLQNLHPKFKGFIVAG